MSRLLKRALAVMGLAAFVGALGVGMWSNRANAAGSKTVAASETISCPITGEPVVADDCPVPCPRCR